MAAALSTGGVINLTFATQSSPSYISFDKWPREGKRDDDKLCMASHPHSSRLRREQQSRISMISIILCSGSTLLKSQAP